MEGMKVLERPGPAYVLAPHVEVTSGVAALDAGQHTWWVAIEVSGRPSPIAGGVSNLGVREWSRTRMGRCSGLEQEGQFEFGSLYDLSVEVLPTGNSSILQVLQEQSFPVTLSIGSMVLILAQVRIDIKQTPKMRKSRPARARETSEDLIEDIAAELGDCEVGYAHVRLSYRHTAFPSMMDTEARSRGSGVSSVQSRVDTVATASVKLHNSLSPWSPPPARRAESSLLAVIERH